MSGPVRTCVGCRRRAPKGELARYVARGRTLALDPSGRAPGRGAYTCRSRTCFEQAVKRRGFARALRATIEIPPGLQAVWREG